MDFGRVWIPVMVTLQWLGKLQKMTFLVTWFFKVMCGAACIYIYTYIYIIYFFNYILVLVLFVFLYNNIFTFACKFQSSITL